MGLAGGTYAADFSGLQSIRAVDLKANMASAVKALPVSAPADNAEETRERISELTGLLVGPGAADPAGPVLRPFTSDGCSMSPDGIPGSKIKWLDCCVRHDIAYWLGGTSGQREEADKALRGCITDKGFHTIGEIYYRGVRLGGGPERNTSYRWGYGWNRLRPYASLKEEELAQAEFLHGKDLSRLLELESRGGIQITESQNSYNFAGKLTAAEIRIYDHLKNSLAADDVVAGAKSDRSNTETLVYSLELKNCPGSFTYIFRKSTQELLKINASGACLKNTGGLADPWALQAPVNPHLQIYTRMTLQRK